MPLLMPLNPDKLNINTGKKRYLSLRKVDEANICSDVQKCAILFFDILRCNNFSIADIFLYLLTTLIGLSKNNHKKMRGKF